MDKNSFRQVADKAIEYARDEIRKFGVPDMMLLDISLDKAKWIATELKARVELTEICVSLMDIKLGQAFKEKRIQDHIAMSVDAASEFLRKINFPEEETSIVLNAIEAHHGGASFKALEAEICANADCYRFIHPKGFFLYLTVLGKRYDNFISCLDQAETKMDEKMKMISLPLVRCELEPIYKTLKNYIALAKE